MIQQNLIALFAENFRASWPLPALTNYSTGESYTYADLARETAYLHEVFAVAGIRQGDHIALMGKDTAEWCILFMATITYGAVIVPILQDFNPADAQQIINHSEARLLFVNTSIYEQFDADCLPETLLAAIDIQNRTILRISAESKDLTAIFPAADAAFAKRFPHGFAPEDVAYAPVSNEQVVVINYTSGTTGFSKGVMLTANNLAGNVTYAMTLGLMARGHNELCFLPLAHAYSCAFNLLTPMAVGAHVYLLGKMPSPRIITEAFKQIRPNLIITVPLIFEKIYKDVIRPRLETPVVSFMLRFPLLKKLVARAIRREMIAGMGGNFKEVIVGGAPINPEVEQFLKRIRFPFTVGYGMTECGPLICYENARRWALHSCGKVLKNIMELRIAEEEGLSAGVGEIQVRGENVCRGYFKNDKETDRLFTPDGWMHTGDLGSVDASGNVFIKGRIKTMILGANGQNIYPEEIESKINNLPFVLESLVVSRNGRLAAIVVPDYQAMERAAIPREEGRKQILDARKILNNEVGSYEKINIFEFREEEFEKTPKRSIKRFAYK